MNKKMVFRTTIFFAAAVLIFAGCSFLGFKSPTATIKDYHRFAEHNSPEAMVKLYSSGYLAKNKNALEDCRKFADLVQKVTASGEKPELSELSETYVGEKAIVKGRYGGPRGGNLRFQARLIKENGDWKIEAFGDGDADLTKEEPEIERSKELIREIEIDGQPSNLSFSPDGKTLACIAKQNDGGDSQNFIYLLDPQTGKVKNKTSVKAKYNARGLQFSADGKLLAATNGDKAIYVWDAENLGSPKQEIVFNDSSQYEDVVAVTFAPDGSLYTGGNSGSLLIYDVNTGKVKQKLEGHPVSSKAAVSSAKSDVPPPPPSSGAGYMIYDIVFSHDGKYFATVSQNEIKVWDAKTGKSLKKLLLPAEIIKGVTQMNDISAVFAPDGKSLLTYSRNGLLEKWNLQTGEVMSSKNLEKLYVGSAEFSPDGKLLTDNGGDLKDPPRGVKIFNAQTGELKASFTGERGQPRAVFSPDNKLAASFSDKDYRKIFLWDTSGIGL